MKINKGLFYSLIMVMIALASVMSCQAQGKRVIKHLPNGNFIEVSLKDTTVDINDMTANATKTPKTFTALDGTIYPIYLSSRGSLYIIRTSKKSGKEYKQYLNNIK